MYILEYAQVGVLVEPYSMFSLGTPFLRRTRQRIISRTLLHVVFDDDHVGIANAMYTYVDSKPHS